MLVLKVVLYLVCCIYQACLARGISTSLAAVFMRDIESCQATIYKLSICHAHIQVLFITECNLLCLYFISRLLECRFDSENAQTF